VVGVFAPARAWAVDEQLSCVEGVGVDAIVLLKEDHKTVNALFKEFEKTKQSAAAPTKRKLVDTIIRELTTHAYIEETIFYPAAGAG
jgi:hemerythrin superfamily protein